MFVEYFSNPNLDNKRNFSHFEAEISHFSEQYLLHIIYIEKLEGIQSKTDTTKCKFAKQLHMFQN